MRILLLAGSYPPETGGIAQFMHTFADGLRAQGVDVEVVANPTLPARGYLKRVEACRAEVQRHLRTQTFDRIVASSWSPYAVPLPPPFEVFCHGMDLLEPSRSVRYRVLMRRTLNRASRILANSRYTAELAIRCGARPASVLVLHPGVDCERFQPAMQPDGEKLIQMSPFKGDKPRSGRGSLCSNVILSIGRLVERKGFDMVLRALPAILTAFPDARYICTGDGPDRERLQQLAASLNISEHVSWPGEVTDDQKLALYQSARVFAMPNRIAENDGSVEGFGIVFLEAAACEVPAVGGNSGGAADAILHGVTGYLVDPVSAQAIAEHIIKLLADSELRLKMGRAARERALRDFREDQIAERYLRVRP